MGADASSIRNIAASIGQAGARATRLGPVVVMKTAKDIEGTAKTMAPVDTGNLKNSIGVERTGDFSAEIGPTANYGIYLELGTSRMAPQPFMAPAFDKHLPAFEQAVAQLGEDALNG
ncbi:HK97-gp10 family putative phage morphogenesis protein [Pseudarthrobacter sp. PS3-L1]|uniref:HK97-gp10 family putative phage morphogenesis protein n=1 Tax=Pseudarthrobacter sp. PS3-L1 TaxID=3046207 RepID=UPI0024BAA6FF|nr:HK97-gp10 family putative phage morphogenesis protein [Pseudarthrobacter sp. PS3-L1]MDJ0321831.1 HK97 gp10 family phage protein [Pseudarthrobacter sp. PS3-L1]